MQGVDCDYIVVGSGAGGGTVAAFLAEAGQRVVLLEETVTALKTPLHPNCYLSPTEFAVKFGLTPTNTDPLGSG